VNRPIRVLVTGGNGQLGRDLCDVLAGGTPAGGVAAGTEGSTGLLPPVDAGTFDVLSTDIDTLDVVDRTAVRAAVDGFRPDLVLHGGAYTAVDACESSAESLLEVQELLLGCVDILATDTDPNDMQAMPSPVDVAVTGWYQSPYEWPYEFYAAPLPLSLDVSREPQNQTQVALLGNVNASWEKPMIVYYVRAWAAVETQAGTGNPASLQATSRVGGETVVVCPPVAVVGTYGGGTDVGPDGSPTVTPWG